MQNNTQIDKQESTKDLSVNESSSHLQRVKQPPSKSKAAT